MGVGATPERARALERAVRTLKGVRGARVHTDDGVAIDVLVVPERARSEAEDQVQSIAAAFLGLPRDSIRVRVTSAAAPPDRSPHGSRRRLSSLSTRRAEGRFSAQVSLSMGADILVGEAAAPAEREFELRSVAHAVLDGLRQVVERPIDVITAEIVSMGGNRLALVGLQNGERMLVGSAHIHFDDHDAIARATFHALNRVLTRVESSIPAR